MYSYEEAIKKSTEYFKGDSLAAEVFVSKYALKDKSGNILEDTPVKMHSRLAKELARIENKYPNPLSEKEIFDFLDGFKRGVAQGSPMAGIGNPYQIMSISNCFTIAPPEDSYSGICFTDQEEAQIMKRRGGVGTDISTLRPKGMVTANAAGTTDGIGVFMERFSNTCREVAQNGRRGALMLTISVHHPEVETFINIKKDLSKVTAANISVRLTDEFLNAVKNDEEYEQRWPVDSKTPKIVQKVKARKIWDQIVDSAWASAEPGLLFWDTVQRETPTECYEDFKSTSTNPCCFSEQTDIMVITDRGMKNLRDVRASDMVWVGDEQRWAMCSGYFRAGLHDVVSVSFSNGEKFIITKNHKLCTTDNTLVEVSELKVGDKIKTNTSSPVWIEGSEKYINSESFVTIDSIEDIQEKHVVGCIEVFAYNKFTANGIISGNSEIVLSNYDSCRLFLINTFGYIKNPFTKNAEFLWENFNKDAQIAQRLMDDIVDLEIESIDKILAKINSDPEPEHIKAVEVNLWKKIRTACVNGRRTGLGITALGDTIAALGMTYGAKDSIDFTEKVYKNLAVSAYRSSVIMAKERGPFPAFNYELEKNHGFIKKIMEAGGLVDDWKKYGRRNIALTTTAPAGSVSILTQTTSGIEPVFLVSYKRRKKINPIDKEARVDFVDNMGDKWQEFTVFHHGFKMWMDINNKTEEDFMNSPYFLATSNAVDWTSSVKLQGTAQKWVCHAISKTCNLPNNASKELVGQIYLDAWTAGCKGFTVYRDGCRSGVLVSDTKNETKDENLFVENHAPKRPKELDCDIYHFSVKGEKWNAFVGIYQDRPYEIFAGRAEFVDIPKSKKHGRIFKNGKYNLIIGKDEEQVTVKDLATIFENPTESAFTRTISLALRHGTPVQYLVEQLEKGADRDSDMFSLAKGLMRVLKNYIKDGTKVSAKKKCQQCNMEDSLIYQEGCLTCKNCGFSKCG